jgi:hypothetical protein
MRSRSRSTVAACAAAFLLSVAASACAAPAPATTPALLTGATTARLTAQPVATASAKAPASFFGVIGDGPLLDGTLSQPAETKLMKKSHVGSLRVAFYWPYMEPSDGTYDFGGADDIVGAAAAAGIDVLPVPQLTPAWAAEDPTTGASPPKDPKVFAAFMTKLVERYGPGGEFWSAHPDLKPRPIRQWQVWNEPDITSYWKPKGAWAPAYVKLLARAYVAIHKADPKAKVIAAGVTNSSWVDLQKIYAAGGKRFFDIAAIHPFSAKVANVMRIIANTRKVMAKNGDAKKPLALTEVSWSSAGNKATAISYGWETSEKGQAARLSEVVRALLFRRTTDHLAGFWWYTWVSPKIGSTFSFDYGGLRRMDGTAAVSKPALAAYAKAAK